MEAGKNILVVDMFNIMIAMNATSNVLDRNTMQIGMYLGTINMIRTFVDKFKPIKIILAYDGPNAGERRRKLYSGYKAGRKVKAKTSSVKLYEGEEQDDYTKYTSQGAFTYQLQKIYEFCKFLPVQSVIVPYLEGDDIISYIALKNKEKYNMIIISGDKDYCQLIQSGIEVYNWREKKLYNSESFYEKFKIDSRNYIFMKVLRGDSSDEIKGIKGFGAKTMDSLSDILTNNIFENVTEFVEFTKTLDLDTFDTRTKNAIKNLWLEETVEEMFLLYRLMKLDENCLDLHHIDMLDKQLEEQEDQKLSRISAMITMQKHEFNKMYNGFNVDKWLSPFVFVKSGIKINEPSR